MYQSQNSYSKKRPENVKITKDTKNLVFNQQIIENFQVIQASSAFFPEQISVMLSGLFENFNCVKILAYKPRVQDTNRIFKGFEDLIEDKTERINSKNCERISLNCDGILKIHLGSMTLRNFYAELGQTAIVPGKNLRTLKSAEKIGRDFRVSKCLALVSSELSLLKYGQTLLCKMIEYDLECRRIPYTLGNSGIRYRENRMLQRIFTSIKCTLLVTSSTLKLKLKLLPTSKPFPSMQELQSTFEKHSKTQDTWSKTGQFILSKTLKYTTSLHYTSLSTTIQLINQYVDHFLTYSNHLQVLSLPQTHSLCTSPSTSSKSFTKVHKTLSPSQYSKEKAILSLLSSVPSLYFPNRFNLTRITEQASNTLVYLVNNSSEPFESFSKYSPLVSIQSIFSLIEELSKIGLVFNTRIFPLELFRWSEEKPVFTYQQPLSEVFEIVDVNETEVLREYCQKAKKQVFDEIYKFKVLAFKEHEFVYSVDECMKVFGKAKFEEVEVGIAKERIALYEENRIEAARRYYGIGSVAGTGFLVGCKRFQESLNEKLESFEEISEFSQFFPPFFDELLMAIESLVAKNTIFGWIDPECIGFTKKGRVIIEIRAKSEVQEIFKAPEVRGGRSSKSSLLYSFGKIVEECFCHFFRIQSQENCEKQETVQKAFESFPDLKNLIKGCTQDKILTRWNIDKVKSGIKAVVSSIIN